MVFHYIINTFQLFEQKQGKMAKQGPIETTVLSAPCKWKFRETLQLGRNNLPMFNWFLLSFIIVQLFEVQLTLFN